MCCKRQIFSPWKFAVPLQGVWDFNHILQWYVHLPIIPIPVFQRSGLQEMERNRAGKRNGGKTCPCVANVGVLWLLDGKKDVIGRVPFELAAMALVLRSSRFCRTCAMLACIGALIPPTPYPPSLSSSGRCPLKWRNKRLTSSGTSNITDGGATGCLCHLLRC